MDLLKHCLRNKYRLCYGPLIIYSIWNHKMSHFTKTSLYNKIMHKYQFRVWILSRILNYVFCISILNEPSWLSYKWAFEWEFGNFIPFCVCTLKKNPKGHGHISFNNTFQILIFTMLKYDNSNCPHNQNLSFSFQRTLYKRGTELTNTNIC